jgi:hypothetical protein
MCTVQLPPGVNPTAVNKIYRFISYQHFSLDSVQAVRGRRPTAAVQVQSTAAPHGICDGQRNNGTGLSPGRSVFPYQQHSTNSPHSLHLSNLTPNTVDRCCASRRTESLCILIKTVTTSDRTPLGNGTVAEWRTRKDVKESGSDFNLQRCPHNKILSQTVSLPR